MGHADKDPKCIGTDVCQMAVMLWKLSLQLNVDIVKPIMKREANFFSLSVLWQVSCYVLQ